MAKNTIQQVFNGNMYFNGVSWAGKVEESTFPDLKFMFTDKKSLSNFAKFQLPTGMDVMEFKAKLNSINKDVIVVCANPFTSSDIMIRTTIQNWEGGDKTNEVPMVAYIKGTSKKMPPIALKQNDSTEIDLEYTVTGYRLEIDGVIVIDADVYANKLIVDGVDLLADYRANLGLD
jgi:P2 family phage contractile tail tube protein